MLIELANHNDDIRRLLEKGYALRWEEGFLIVRDIPYLDDQGNRQIGAIVAKLIQIDNVRVRQDNHQVYFAGSVPHGLDGRPIPNLAGGPTTIPLKKPDVVVQRSFSNKPANGFPDFFAKIEHYVGLISGPAIHKYGGREPFTFCIDTDEVPGSVFKFHDTLSSRAEIGDLSALFSEDVVAAIGLGGSGSYLLDFLVKTPVKEIRGFDHDDYYVHNAFRSPGELNEVDLGMKKAEVYQRRYANFRTGLNIQNKLIDRSSAGELKGVTFAFVCVDKGSARAEIFDLLIELRIPFIDIGMGLDRKRGALAGMLRATYYSPDNAAEIRAKNLAEMVDHPDDDYRANVQIAELNALNACLAIIRFRQLRGFYVDDSAAYHMLMDIAGLRLFSENGA